MLILKLIIISILLIIFSTTYSIKENDDDDNENINNDVVLDSCRYVPSSNNNIVYVIEDKQYYLLQNNEYIPIEDEYSAILLGYNKDRRIEVKNVDILNYNYAKSDKVIHKFVSTDSRDEYKDYKDKYITYSEELEYINNLYMSQIGIKLVTKAYQIRLDGYKKDIAGGNGAIAPITNDLYLFKCNHHGYYWTNNQLVQQLSLNNKYNPIIPLDEVVREQDHRLLRLPNGDLITVFTSHVGDLLPEPLDGEGRPDTKTGIRFLKLNSKKDKSYKYTITNATILFTDENLKSTKISNEKNWSPFNYKSKSNDLIFFIQWFEPLHIVQIDYEKTNKPTYLPYHNVNYLGYIVSTVSRVPCSSFKWNYGGLRGGTQAEMVRGNYFGILHSVSKHSTISYKGFLKGRTYFMGAYTFSTTIPFYPKSISTFPILSEFLSPNLYYRNGLVVFPVSFFLRNNDGTIIKEGQVEKEVNSTMIVITVGFNNNDTRVVEINLSNLLSSLTPIYC